MTEWERIVREHGPLVFATAWRILGRSPDVEDVVQDVFLEVFRLHRRGPVRCWPALLRRLATFRAVDCLRRRRVSRPLDNGRMVDAVNGPEAEAIGHELAERLRHALAELPGQESAVFCLRFFDDLPYQQIADLLSISTGAVAQALHKARARLQSLLIGPATECAHES